MLKHIALAATIAMAACIALPAQTLQSISSMKTVTKVKKERKVSDQYIYVAPQGGVIALPDETATPTFGIVGGYKHRIGQTNFMAGGQLTVQFDIHNEMGAEFDIAPTVSYMTKPGRFYNSFEATIGLGLGWRRHPGGFAFVPEVNLTYWFNWFGVGATFRYSMQKDKENISYSPYTDQVFKTYEPANQKFIGARFSFRF